MMSDPAHAAVWKIATKTAETAIDTIAKEIKDVHREAPVLNVADFAMGVSISVSVMIAQTFGVIREAYGERHALSWITAVLGDIAQNMKGTHKIDLAITMVRKDADS